MKITDEEQKQLMLLSDILNSSIAKTASAEAEEHRVVARLKGEGSTSHTNIVEALAGHVQFLESKILELESAEYQRQEEIKTVVAVLSKLTKNAYEATAELSSLSARYGIY
jgi:hypothetical protein